MRRLKNKDGKVVAIELTAEEMAKALEISTDDIETWQRCIPPASTDNGTLVYRIKSPKDIALLKKRAALLRTRMPEQAVVNVEKSGLLDAYAALAEDCPPGLTAHVWRSYGLVVLMQVRYGKMIDPAELAERANLTEVDAQTGEPKLSVKLAEQHMRLLRGLGYLEFGEGEWAGQWKHQGLPAAWQGLD